MKSELEISPDNEVLDSFSEETPRAPAACQGETEASLTNLDKVWRYKVFSLIAEIPIHLWNMQLVCVCLESKAFPSSL